VRTRRIKGATVLLEPQPPLPACCRRSELDHCCRYLASYYLYLAMGPSVCFRMADIQLRKVPGLTGTLA
jgi:hypothetical protein